MVEFVPRSYAPPPPEPAPQVALTPAEPFPIAVPPGLPYACQPVNSFAIARPPLKLFEAVPKTLLPPPDPPSEPLADIPAEIFAAVYQYELEPPPPPPPNAVTSPKVVCSPLLPWRLVVVFLAPP